MKMEQSRRSGLRDCLGCGEGAEPVDGALEAIFERDFRMIGEVVADAADIGAGEADIAGAWWCELWGQVCAEDTVECIDELEQRDGATGADVVGEGVGGELRSEGSAEEGLDGVVDVGEIAGLEAIAEDGGGSAVAHGVDE
jgi:hypothetical protein